MPGKILIVDDIATNRIVLKVKLSAAFYEVIQASSGAEALEIAQDQRPDLLLTSDRLPDMSGADLCQTLHKTPDCAAIPVIVTTANAQPDTRFATLLAGADEVITKPLDDMVLMARLRSLLRARATTDELQLRDGTNRALGFAENPPAFERPAIVLLTSTNHSVAKNWAGDLCARSSHSFETTPLPDVMPHLANAPHPDAIVIALDQPNEPLVTRLIADIRARAETRHIPLLVVLSHPEKTLAAGLLDLGANDMMSAGFNAPEMLLRLGRLIQHKRKTDRMRDDMRDGLKAAVVDPLTGLFNRRYALPHLSRLAMAAGEKNRNFAVMLADLDHFKKVNDRYGHAAGDAVLVAISRVIKENLRAVDLVSRIGGEEFLIAMPDTTRTKAEAAAKRLCSLIENEPIRLPNRPTPVHVTVSIGVAMGAGCNSSKASGVEALIERADQALYSAKSAGRNKVTLATRPAA